MITVLIPTSPIPSHPSTSIIDETISNIRKYTDAHIIIMIDGIHESLEHRRTDYEVYKNAIIHKTLNGEYGDCRCLPFHTHTHQAKMTREALQFVKTPLILFCEHDTSPIGDIPFVKLCEFVLNTPDVNYIRFNIFHMILPEHRQLMISDPKEVDGVRFVRTIQWSQRPHIALSDWYRKILKDHFGPEHKTMIEDVMHSVVQCAYHEKEYDTFGLTIYTPEGIQLRSYHSDGRKDDVKIVEA